MVIPNNREVMVSVGCFPLKESQFVDEKPEDRPEYDSCCKPHQLYELQSDKDKDIYLSVSYKKSTYYLSAMAGYLFRINKKFCRFQFQVSCS